MDKDLAEIKSLEKAKAAAILRATKKAESDHTKAVKQSQDQLKKDKESQEKSNRKKIEALKKTLQLQEVESLKEAKKAAEKEVSTARKNVDKAIAVLKSLI